MIKIAKQAVDYNEFLVDKTNPFIAVTPNLRAQSSAFLYQEEENHKRKRSIYRKYGLDNTFRSLTCEE